MPWDFIAISFPVPSLHSDWPRANSHTTAETLLCLTPPNIPNCTFKLELKYISVSAASSCCSYTVMRKSTKCFPVSADEWSKSPVGFLVSSGINTSCLCQDFNDTGLALECFFSSGFLTEKGQQSCCLEGRGQTLASPSSGASFLSRPLLKGPAPPS